MGSRQIPGPSYWPSGCSLLIAVVNGVGADIVGRLL